MDIEFRIFVFDIEPDDVEPTTDFLADALVLRGYGNRQDGDTGLRSVIAVSPMNNPPHEPQEAVFRRMIDPATVLMVCTPNAGESNER